MCQMKKELKSENVGKYKNSQHYRQAFRIKLINDLVANQESMSFIARKHGIPADSLGGIKRNILNELGYYRILEEMKKNQKDHGSNAEKQVEALKKALELATMKVAALETLIDVAEDRHNINIRKKTGSKQSK